MSDPDARWGYDDTETEPEPGALMMATTQLLELARAVRGQRWRDDLAPALVAAQSNGWDWPRRGRAACLLIFDPEADPRSLADASRDPVRRISGPSEPSPEWRRARQELERKRAGR